MRIVDAVDGGGRGRNGDLGVDNDGKIGHGLLGFKADGTELDDAVDADAQTSGFEVDEHEGAFQIQVSKHGKALLKRRKPT